MRLMSVTKANGSKQSKRSSDPPPWVANVNISPGMAERHWGATPEWKNRIASEYTIVRILPTTAPFAAIPIALTFKSDTGV